MANMKEDGLTGKQRAFVAEYLVDLNGRQAAIRAGYAADNAAVEASRLLRNAKVADAIDTAMAQRAGITRTFIIDELAKIARANAGDFFEWGSDGVKLKASADLSEEQRGAVAEVSESKTTTGGTIRVKLSDKQAALEKLGRALGMFGDRIVVSELMEEVAELRRMLAARRAAKAMEIRRRTGCCNELAKGARRTEGAAPGGRARRRATDLRGRQRAGGGRTAAAAAARR